MCNSNRNFPATRGVQWLSLGVVMAGLSLTFSAHVQGEDIKLTQLPDVVRKAADKAVPKAKWESASKETEDNKEFWYEIEGTDTKGRYIHISVYADGKIDELSTEIQPKDVPKVVSTALTTKFPRFKASAIYEVRNAQIKLDRFDFTGQRPKDKMEIVISVSPDGKKVEVDE